MFLSAGVSAEILMMMRGMMRQTRRRVMRKVLRHTVRRVLRRRRETSYIIHISTPNLDIAQLWLVHPNPPPAPMQSPQQQACLDRPKYIVISNIKQDMVNPYSVWSNFLMPCPAIAA